MRRLLPRNPLSRGKTTRMTGPTRPEQAEADAPPPTLDLIQFLRIVADHWRGIVITAVSAGLVGAAVSLVLPKYYRAEVVFLPERGATAALRGALAGLAQFGLQLGLEAEGESPRIYQDLAMSRSILERLLWTPVPSVGNVPERPLIDWILPPQDDSTKRVQQAVQELAKAIEIRSDLQTGVVRVALEARSAVVASAAANRLVEYFDDFNVSKRKSRAQERRRFVEVRYREARGELAEAEAEAVRFLERNRLFQTSPELVQAYERLQRQLQVRQEVSLTLARELETARISEVNDTPVLTLIDTATPPALRHRPRRTFITIAMGMLGFVVGLGYAFVREHVERRAAGGDPDIAALGDRWRTLRSRVGRTRATGSA